MATNPGEWYEEQRQEAERLGHELAGARAVLDAITAPSLESRASLLEAAYAVVKRLQFQLELARHVGD